MSGTDQEDLSQLVHGLVRAATEAEGRNTGTSEPPTEPREAAPGVIAAIADPGEEPLIAAAGHTIACAADGAVLDDAGRERAGAREVGRHTLFDLASVTKVVTTLVAATFIEQQLLDVEAPAVEYVPVADPRITVRHLLTHTSGLPPVMPLWRVPGDRDAKFDAVAHADLIGPPGGQHAYSCIGFIQLGRILERLGGERLPALARSRVLEPAGARRAGWSPDPQDPDIAATEYQSDPPRGLVRGTVHDETAWSLGDSANAGVFADVDDAIAIARVLADAGGPVPIGSGVWDLLRHDQLPTGPATDAGWAQGLGLRMGQALPGGRVAPQVVGHPGFTGTSIAADPASGRVAVLLTNRVHPSRDRFTVERTRQEFARIAFDSAEVGTA